MPRVLSPLTSLAATAVIVAGFGIVGAASAHAASADCQTAGTFLSERKGLVEKLNGLGKKKNVDARTACGVFTKLFENGTRGIKWIDANKDWCQIPDAFAEGFKKDHQRVTELKGKACAAAAQQAAMEKRARQAGGPGGPGGPGGGLLGGPGLTGQYHIPQGAL